MTHWHIITGEYPPQRGGVADYTQLVARELARAGDRVEVWAPQCHKPRNEDDGVRLHRLPGHFGPRALIALDRAIGRSAGERVLVQYVPHAFGLKAMNLPLCAWLYARRHWNIDVMFHEVAFARRIRQPLRHNVLGEVTWLMAALAARSARRVFVAAQAWEKMVRGLCGKPIGWLPVPSNIPRIDNPHAIREIRGRYAGEQPLIGHLGTYGSGIRPYLEAAVPALLADRRLSVLLLGRGSVQFRDTLIGVHPAIAPYLHAAADLAPEQLSVHLAACDLMIQPYPDGISTRRTSAMAALAHALPVVTTRGALTEPLWLDSGAVAMTSTEHPADLVIVAVGLLRDSRERRNLAYKGNALYRERFDVAHSVGILRAV